ncbi:DUF4118 domain-containing protein [Dactylosporangium sp. NPDC005572]|uniref:sensor histidine kinase n=1 Tax=Dactylosporangium sp. NPDC005572 TaxID=3156889 RepID=UPI0033A0EBEF
MRTGLMVLVRPPPPPYVLGIAFALSVIVVETLIVHQFRAIASHLALSFVYLFGVLLVSMVWGLWLSLATALASALAFVLFHGRQPGLLVAPDVGDWVEVAFFLVVALLVGAVGELSRKRAERAQDSGLVAEIAHLLQTDMPTALPAVEERIGRAFGLSSVTISSSRCRESVHSGHGDAHVMLPLREGAASLGAMYVPARTPKRTLRRLQERVVPPLASLLQLAYERSAMIASLGTGREELRRLAQQQAALRRVATLIAHGARPAEVFDAVAVEVSQLLGKYHTNLLRYEAHNTFTVVSTNQPGPIKPSVVDYWPIDKDTIVGQVQRTGRAARIDRYEGSGPGATLARKLGVCSAVGAPIVVEGRLWGVATVSCMRPEPLPADAEARIEGFTELLATAIANAESRSQLLASRARIVSAADEARRRIERDLHDGAQQQLVSLMLAMRTTEDGVPPELCQFKAKLSQMATSLSDIVENLHELSRGIHPAILTQSGLGAAVKALARRSSVPVEVDVQIDQRLPSGVEVAAYFVVSESLTNAAKHAHATVVRVDLQVQQQHLHLSVCDDGVGGADSERGSGLTGLKDRVEALGGHLTMESPAGGGTCVSAMVPVCFDETPGFR